MKKMNEGMFTSNSSEWETPQWIFDQLNNHFEFTIDVAASEKNKKVDRYYSVENSGLDKHWTNERCFLNPPYGTEIKDWVRKASEERKNNALIVCLLPARIDTAWFSDYVAYKAGAIILLKGRLKFSNGDAKTTSAPFPSMVCVFNALTEDYIERLHSYVTHNCKNKLSVYM
jgi:site-specific DNA-methyltransferase (adenine-specific)